VNASVQDKLKSLVEDDEIISYLKQSLQFRAVCDAILCQRVIDQAASSRSIEILGDEVQAEIDSVRHQLQLEKAADTLAWLDNQAIAPEDWEAGVRNRLLNQKLKQHLFQAGVEKYFNENRLSFDKILLYQLVVPYHQLAQELFYQIEEEEISFFEAAHLYDIDEARRHCCGYEGFVNRQSLPAVISAALFSASVGELVGPVEMEEGYHLLLCQSFVPGELTDDVRESILDRLFQEWLTGELSYLLHNESL
jgi:parvulin-like peptidyl-prolyl isomerase